MKDENSLRFIGNTLSSYGLKEFLIFDILILIYLIILNYAKSLLSQLGFCYDYALLITYVSTLAYSIIVYYIMRKTRLFSVNESKFINQKCKFKSFMSVYALQSAFDFYIILIYMLFVVYRGNSLTDINETILANLNPFVKIIIVAIIAPISEELIFRGIGISSLKKYGRTTAIFLTSLLFGICHSNYFQSINAIISGIGLAYISLEYGLFYSILLHMINNFVVSLIYITTPMITFFIIGTLGICGVFVILKKGKNIEKYLFNGSFNKRVFSFGLYLFSIAFVFQSLIKKFL